jgi:hypothetical protein
MKTSLCGVLWLLLFAALFAGQAGTAAAADGVDDIEKRLQDLDKQIQALGQQQQALLKARAELRKEAAEKRDQYAKVEIRGRLGKEKEGGPGRPGPVWVVAFGELTWRLDLGTDKKLLATAEGQVGQPVVIVGKVVGQRGPGGSFAAPFGPEAVVIVEALKATKK